MDDELIKFNGVAKWFGRKEVISNLSLTIPENKITGIIGASGEGKTTLLKLLVGFYKPTKGEILYSKRKVLEEKNLKNIFGFSTEECSFHSRLTVIENLYHFGALHHVRRKELKKRVEEIIDLVELNHARKTIAGDLSMGMKKRLDVAISLIHEPSVLIMDEPTADLDPLLRVKMLDLMKKVNKKGTTIIFTTQILRDMDKVCNKIAILFEKKILHQGNPNTIKRKYGCSNLEEVFNKIFSKEKKEKLNEIKKEDNLKKKDGNIEKKIKDKEEAKSKSIEENSPNNQRGKEKNLKLTEEQLDLIQEKIDLSMNREDMK